MVSPGKTAAVPKLKTGRLCLELVATVRGRLGTDTQDDIATSAGLEDWLSQLTGRPSGPSGVAEFQELREAVFRLTSAVTGESAAGPRAADIALVNKRARGDVPIVQLRAAGKTGLAAEVPEATGDQTLTAIARDAVDLLTGPELGRLHQCQADPCGSFYMDTSRGGQRRWCSSASCGNRIRVAAHRDRHRP
jgi:predicted RNA-binding Zn ribbon-like protein